MWHLSSISTTKSSRGGGGGGDILFLHRQKGIVLYFRYKQDEYAIYGRFNQTLFQSSNNIFEIQIANYIVKSEIQNNKAHHKFIRKFLELKNESLN